MNSDTSLTTVARRFSGKTIRPDRAGRPTMGPVAELPAWSVPAVVCALALLFVVLGAGNLDIGGSAEGRLGLSAGERPGPLGRVFGYWAPDVWPAQVLPSWLLGKLELGGRPSSAAIRWPAALAAIGAGWLLARRMAAALSVRAGILLALCWFGSLGLFDRSSATGLDLITGLGLLAALDRMIARGADFWTGLWLSLAFLAGGWPPLVVAALAAIVIGKPITRRSLASLIAPLITMVAWSITAVLASGVEVWAAALTLPVTRKPDWLLGPNVFILGLPWSPFALLVFARSARASWREEGRPWIAAWLQVSGGSLIAGTLVPGLGQPALAVVLAGTCMAAAASLSAAWGQSLARIARTGFLVAFLVVAVLWLILMTYGSFLWTVAMPFYRTLGVVMALAVIAVAGLGAWAIDAGNPRRGLLALVLMAAGLKLVHWGYYVPEWNYRFSQGPWARAVSQWVPRNWPLYTVHDWPPDLAFFMKRPVRQLHGPHHLRYQPGPESKYVLLSPSEFENWPKSALPLSIVVKLEDKWAQGRILARTPGPLPPPFGPNPARLAAAEEPPEP